MKTWEITKEQDDKPVIDFASNSVETHFLGASRWYGTFSGYKDGAPLALSGSTAITATFTIY